MESVSVLINLAVMHFGTNQCLCHVLCILGMFRFPSDRMQLRAGRKALKRKEEEEHFLERVNVCACLSPRGKVIFLWRLPGLSSLFVE